MKGLAISSLFLLILFGNILWFWLKLELKKNGFQVNYFKGHIKDLTNAVDVINQSDEPRIRRNFTLILSTLILIIILIPTIFFINRIELGFRSIESQRCKRFNDYLDHQIIGTIESKYIDKQNHAFKTLNFTNGKREVEVTLFVKGLYDFLQSGDSIRKISGNSELKVFRNNQEKTFNVIQADWCKE